MENRWYFLRATLQSKSPLIIDSGETDALSDTDPVRDANGLPMLPATALAGVLRSAVGDPNDKAWFGDQVGDESTRSAVILTDGLFHWSDDKPRDGLVLDVGSTNADHICKYVLPGQRILTRDHVQLNEWGVVAGSGKFERDAVPTGARFTFEMRTKDKAAFDALLAIIKEGIFLGGATRTGYGEMACVSIGQEMVELPSGWDRWCELMGADISTSPD
jgi:CRISPR/Cas system CSM-associated protein Csm3 (group 7 of RAMP superfamily)